MISNRAVTLADLLLLFLYLEVLAMVSLYYSSGKLPIRFPLYISIVALARYIIIDMKSLEKDELIYIAIAILLISFNPSHSIWTYQISLSRACEKGQWG